MLIRPAHSPKSHVDFQPRGEQANQMEDRQFILKQARALIGTRVLHEGHDCTVIDVLEDKLQLILEADRASNNIQSDAYGNARREMRALYNVPLCSEDGTKLNPLLVPFRHR